MKLMILMLTGIDDGIYKNILTVISLCPKLKFQWTLIKADSYPVVQTENKWLTSCRKLQRPVRKIEHLVLQDCITHQHSMSLGYRLFRCMRLLTDRKQGKGNFNEERQSNLRPKDSGDVMH